MFKLADYLFEIYLWLFKSPEEWIRLILVSKLLKIIFHVLQQVHLNNNDLETNIKGKKKLINNLKVDFYKTCNVFTKVNTVAA